MPSQMRNRRAYCRKLSSSFTHIAHDQIQRPCVSGYVWLCCGNGFYVKSRSLKYQAGRNSKSERARLEPSATRQENGRQENGRQENGRQENGRQENGRKEN